MRFSFAPQLFCEKNLEYIKPKLDSGKEWKPSKSGKEDEPAQQAPIRLGAKKPAQIIHPVVGDHLKMEDDPNMDQGPGKIGQINHQTSRLSVMIPPSLYPPDQPIYLSMPSQRLNDLFSRAQGGLIAYRVTQLHRLQNQEKKKRFYLHIHRIMA